MKRFVVEQRIVGIVWKIIRRSQLELVPTVLSSVPTVLRSVPTVLNGVKQR